MRIHTDKIDVSDLDVAAERAGVTFAKRVQHGSRTRSHAWEVQLYGTSPRRPNSGTGGAVDDCHFAATWDEWGILLNHLFEIDPNIVCQPYNGAAEFEWKTGGRYATLPKEDQHHTHRWESAGIARAQACDCGAVRRF